MDLELDAEQVALVDTVRTVLSREWPVTALRRLVEEGTGADVLWNRLVELDWPALCVPEDDGGMGYGAVESMLVVEGCGAAVVPGPLVATQALFVPAVVELATDEQQRRLLAGVADGARTGSAAFTELTVASGSSAVTATRHDSGWTLHGTARSVIEGDAVDAVVVPARLDRGTVAAFVVAPDDASAEPVRTVDASRRLATLRFDATPAEALGDPADTTVPERLDGVVDVAVTALAAELVGTCSTILETTLDHVKTREQFGVPIGSFQALKHRLADCYLALEAARASVRVASVALAEGDPRSGVLASSAKGLAGDAASLLTTDGIQFLGGLGFTWEHDMHLFVKRAMTASALLGTAEFHRQRVADRIGMVPA